MRLTDTIGDDLMVGVKFDVTDTYKTVMINLLNMKFPPILDP